MAELELAIDCCPDQKAQKRLNTMHLLLCGASFELARKHARVSERCLQKWISRFNEAGIDAITYHPVSGRPRVLTDEVIEAEILPVVDDPNSAGEYHWTVTKLCGWLREEKDLDLSYRTLVRYLHEHNYARRIPRRIPLPSKPEQWGEQREAFVDQLFPLIEDPNAEVFFGDEAGFEGDPRPRLKWVKRGSRPTVGYYGGHVRSNVVGAVSPRSGQLVSLIVPYCDRFVFQQFLDTMADEVPARRNKRVYLVLDNAGWHKVATLNWHHITPLYLPPYSPDLNPIERLWQHLKSHYLAGFITGDHEELDQKIEDSIRTLLNRPETIRSVCNTHSE
jgi:transposase